MGDFVYDFACLAGLKNCEEVAGYVFGVDKFHFLVHVCVRTSFLKTRQCRRVSTTETRPQLTFFLSGCCMAQRKVVVRAVALLSAKTK